MKNRRDKKRNVYQSNGRMFIDCLLKSKMIEYEETLSTYIIHSNSSRAIDSLILQYINKL